MSGAFAALVPVLEGMGVNVEALRVVWETFSNFLNDVYNSMIAPLFDGFREMVDDTAQNFSENSDSIMNIFKTIS